MADGADHVLPHKKAQAADGNEAHDNPQHQDIPGEARHAGIGPGVASQNVEARVAEGGNTVKNRIPQPPAQAEHGHKAQREERRAGKLQQAGADQRVLHHPYHAGQVVHPQGGGDGKPLGKADAPVQRQKNQGDHAHETQAAQLDQAQDHHLAEGAPVEPRVLNDEARDAGGGGGGEQAVQPGGEFPALGGDRQAQQQRTQEYDKGKAHCQKAGGLKSPVGHQMES